MNLYSEKVAVMKAFCDENRWKILELLKGGERCACVLLNKLEITQPTLSHHMKILCDSGVVTARKEGKWTHYSLSQPGLERACLLLQELSSDKNANQSSDTDSDCCCKNLQRSAAAMEHKTKLYALTGFLGSGKTTLLLKLIDELKGKKIGIIQNEFGKLGIDGTILRNDDIQMVELNRGSIFCSCLRLSFVQALAEMAEHHFDYLFVESSGIGDPSNMAEILTAAKTLCGDVFDYSGSLCLVDAQNFLEELDDMESVSRQLKHCHLAVITKVDLVNAERLLKVKEKIRELNPVCPIETSANASLDLDFLQQDLMRYQWAENEETTNSEETKPKTLFLNFEGEVPQEKLTNFLLTLAPDLYRAKGFFRLQAKGWHQVDLVGNRVDIKPCPEQPKSQMVFISKTGTALIRRLFSVWEQEVGLKMELKN